MIVKKFYGQTTRDALRQVRDELGPDALILSNRPTSEGGVEIMAVADADVSALANHTNTANTPAKPEPRARIATETPTTDKVKFPQAKLVNTPTEPPKVVRAVTTRRHLERSYAVAIDDENDSRPEPTLQAQAPTPAPISKQTPSAKETPTTNSLSKSNKDFNSAANSNIDLGLDAPKEVSLGPDSAQTRVLIQEQEKMAGELKHITEELKQLKDLLKSQLATFAWSEMEQQTPNRAELFKHLLSSGFSAHLIRQLTEKLPPQYQGVVAQQWARSALIHNLKCQSAENDIIDAGGVFALVGPTGVGKTTTVAKLAARATVKYGPQGVALITTDSYRIGAQDQLRIYGKILGIPVYSIQSESDLHLTLADLTQRKVVLIDTIGMSQKDARIAQQLAMFKAANRPIKRILLLAANADGHHLEDVVKRYRGEGLSGAILSKLDETLSLGAPLDVLIRHRIKLFYLTNGQRVPEDLHHAHAEFLIDQVMKSPGPDTAFTPNPKELAMVNAAQNNWDR